MQQQLVALTYSGSHTGKPLLLGRAAAAAAAAAQPQQGDIRSPLPLLRHLLQCLPPEPPLDLQAAAMAAAAEAASPAAGGRSRAFKAPRLAATGGKPYCILLFAAGISLACTTYDSILSQHSHRPEAPLPLPVLVLRRYGAFPHGMLTVLVISA